MKYAECKNLNKNKAANSEDYFSPTLENFVDINTFLFITTTHKTITQVQIVWNSFNPLFDNTHNKF